MVADVLGAEEVLADIIVAVVADVGMLADTVGEEDALATVETGRVGAEVVLAAVVTDVGILAGTEAEEEEDDLAAVEAGWVGAWSDGIGGPHQVKMGTEVVLEEVVKAVESEEGINGVAEILRLGGGIRVGEEGVEEVVDDTFEEEIGTNIWEGDNGTEWYGGMVGASRAIVLRGGDRSSISSSEITTVEMDLFLDAKLEDLVWLMEGQVSHCQLRG